MAKLPRPELVLNESSPNFLLQLTSRKREQLLSSLRVLADSLHEDPIGIETDSSGRPHYVRIINGWEITYWADWENELRIVRIQNF